MPIPLVIRGAVIVATATVGVATSGSAAFRIRRAKGRYARRRILYDSFIDQYRKKHHFTSEQFDDLMRVRLKALITLGEAVRFLEKAKLKERDLSESFQIPAQRMLEWKQASLNAVDVLGGLASSITSGAVTAASAYSMVGLLASASTGTGISTLSGAAATNATLAWLGGGSLAAGGGGIAAGTVVLGGLVVGPAVMAVGFVATWQASKVKTQVEKGIAEMDVDQANMVAKTARTLGTMLEVAIIDKDGRLVDAGMEA
jgi:hypothetical protein